MKREEVQHLADPSLALVVHTYHPRGIDHDDKSKSSKAWTASCKERGGFNPFTKEFTPLKFGSANMEVHEALDGITAAVEAGVVDGNRWAAQLFANKRELDDFLAALEGYDECFRITDRWWQALAAMVGTGDEEQFVSSSEIADGLRESIVEGKTAIVKAGAWAAYQSKNPFKLVKVTEAEQEALWKARLAALHRVRMEGLKENISCHFPFHRPFYEFKGEELFAREATAADVAGLSAKKTQAAKPVPKPAAKRGKQRTV